MLPLSRTYGKERPQHAPFVQELWQGSAPSLLPLSRNYGKEAPPACSLCPGNLGKEAPPACRRSASDEQVTPTQSL